MKNLKPVKNINPSKPLSPLIMKNDSCICGSEEKRIKITDLKKYWISKSIHTAAGEIPIVHTHWIWKDRINLLRARASSYRNKYSIDPGLYGTGTPDDDSPIVVTANYKMSFDKVRKSLNGINAWIVVLDTKGINVWCAAGKGTFGTEELIRKINSTKLKMISSKREIIVPQLGAVGVSASNVKKATGFRVIFGPVEVKDLPEYIDNGFKASSKMRKIKFTIADRFVLTPMELNPAFKKIYKPSILILLFLGVESNGILFSSIIYCMPLLVMLISSVIMGAFITPVFLPFIPFRSFAIKGFLTGLAIPAAAMLFTENYIFNSIYIKILMWIIFPMLSSYLALQFTGSTTFTGITGVEREIRLTLPLYIATLVISSVLIILYKLSSWGII